LKLAPPDFGSAAHPLLQHIPLSILGEDGVLDEILGWACCSVSLEEEEWRLLGLILSLFCYSAFVP
jgi:hypothetical protein